MRLWSLHPRLLDRQGLTACWREALLAQAVLAGRTRGYRHHPQLARFRAAEEPVATVGAFLEGLADEAEARGYRFDRGRIASRGQAAAWRGGIPVTTGQLAVEWAHLAAKLAGRSPPWLAALGAVPAVVEPHPLFRVVQGPVEPWEVSRRSAR